MSAPSVSQVKTWSLNSHVIADAASAIDGKVDEFDRVMNSLIRDVDAVMDSWKGDAAAASQAATNSEKQISSRLGMGILQIADALTTQGADFVHACESAKLAAEHVSALGYVVADNGTVSPPPAVTGGFPADVPSGLAPEDALPIATANAATHQSDLSRALAAAGEADAALAAVVANAADALGQAADRATASVPVSPQVRAILDDKAELPADPKALNAFWNSLTANEKAELWNHDRNAGNLDGVPAADRDHFNRRNLVDLQRHAQQQLDKPEPEFRPSPRWSHKEDSPGYRAWKKDHDAAQQQLDGLKALDDRLTSQSDPPLYLLAVKDNGQAVVSVNNPDTADNVSTYVPGTGTNIGTLNGDIDRSEKMVASASRADPTATTAVVAWQDYQAPQDIKRDAWQPHYAEDASGSLDRFQNGIAATHVGADNPHTSVLGHSYGTTVVGQAALDPHTLNTDDVILVASPGLADLGNVNDLHLTGVPSSDNGNHVWATVADNDPIRWTPGVVLGDKPWSEAYGASLFSSDPSGGHSDYWNDNDPALVSDNNPALENIGRIISDRTEAVTRP
ncbi:alpha/beta hydrolase family protein [Williamsia herbipolensis]|uniref:Alpha/beta hydrolase family protein n=1 Tax=Williamsia herbipolensis TaxID=1603258 RepID=A0AAU4K146_9NOCA|nr:alpha/beta hydrolase [Williamsia herbipolensis]